MRGAVNRYAQTSEAMRKSAPGRKPDRDFTLLQDCCQAQLLDPGLAGDAVQFMSLQARVHDPDVSGFLCGRFGQGRMTGSQCEG